MMRSQEHSKKSNNKVVRCLKAPFRALRKARDGYIRILTSCASSIDYEYCPSHFPRQNHELLRSYSERSMATSNVREEAVLMELTRAASVPSLSHGNEMDVFSPKQLRVKMRARGLPKNMGRIVEDKPCEFQDNDVVIVERRPSIRNLLPCTLPERDSFLLDIIQSAETWEISAQQKAVH